MVSTLDDFELHPVKDGDKVEVASSLSVVSSEITPTFMLMEYSTLERNFLTAIPINRYDSGKLSSKYTEVGAVGGLEKSDFAHNDHEGFMAVPLKLEGSLRSVVEGVHPLIQSELEKFVRSTSLVIHPSARNDPSIGKALQNYLNVSGVLYVVRFSGLNPSPGSDPERCGLWYGGKRSIAYLLDSNDGELHLTDGRLVVNGRAIPWDQNIQPYVASGRVEVITAGTIKVTTKTVFPRKYRERDDSADATGSWIVLPSCAFFTQYGLTPKR